MRSYLNFENGKFNKCFKYFQLSLLGMVFLYYFIENFVFSHGWEMLSFRSIDDYAMQFSIREMHEAMFTGDWKRVFTYFGYGYGNFFWLLNSVFLFPLYFFDNPQLQIVLGRQISLVFVFASIYVFGLIIEKMRPDVGELKYPILLIVAVSPIVAMTSTKLHVNPQSLFFGMLSIFFLLRKSRFFIRDVILSSVFLGLAAGMKLTALVLLPVVLSILFFKLKENRNGNYLITFSFFVIFFTIVLIFCVSPVLFLFPFYLPELNRFYDIFVAYKNMGSSSPDYTWAFLNTLHYYSDIFLIFSSFFLFLFLLTKEFLRKNYKFFVPSVLILLSFLLVFFFVRKEPVYRATYFINLGFFFFLGFLGLNEIRGYKTLKVTIIYIACGFLFFFPSEFRGNFFNNYNYFKMVHADNVIKKLQALNEMKSLLKDHKRPYRVYQDVSPNVPCTVFPFSKFTRGVDVVLNYGSLHEYDSVAQGKYDFILLNTQSFFGAGKVLEMSVREKLIQTGIFFDIKYTLIYRNNDLLLFQIDEGVSNAK